MKISIEWPDEPRIDLVLPDDASNWTAGHIRTIADTIFGADIETDNGGQVLIYTGIWLEPCLQVIIEVIGGVASVEQCPDGVEVEIIDHDSA